MYGRPPHKEPLMMGSLQICLDESVEIRIGVLRRTGDEAR
jgi:hypothetical protein